MSRRFGSISNCLRIRADYDLASWNVAEAAKGCGRDWKGRVDFKRAFEAMPDSVEGGREECSCELLKRLFDGAVSLVEPVLTYVLFS